MKPTDVSTNLRKIAAAIDASKSPSPELVAGDIRKILAAMEETALPKPNAGKSMLKDFLDQANEALESGDEAAFKAAVGKLSKHG